MVKFGGNLRCNFSGVELMDVNAKIGIDSKRTTAASVAIVGVVVYLALVHLKPILMPLAIAVLLFFLIKRAEPVVVGAQTVHNSRASETPQAQPCLLYTSPSPRDS